MCLLALAAVGGLTMFMLWVPSYRSRHAAVTASSQQPAVASGEDPPERSFTMVGAGLTHLSIAVDDMAEAQAAVRSAGGTVIADPGGGFACMVCDPEGQLIELIHTSVRPVAHT